MITKRSTNITRNLSVDKATNYWVFRRAFMIKVDLYHMVEELPEAFQNENAEKLTPWNEDSIIVR